MPKPKRRAPARPTALKHGLLSDMPVIPGVETPDEWVAFREAWFADLQPVGFAEEALAHLVALSYWRLRRVHRFESDWAARRLEKIPHDIGVSLMVGRDPPSLAGLLEKQRVLHACLEAFRALEDVDEEAPLSVRSARLILFAVASRDEDLRKRILVASDQVAADAWTAVTVIEMLARLLPGQDIRMVLTDSYAGVRKSVAEIDERVTETHRSVEHMKRDLALPHEQMQERILRYESQYERAFYRAYHELEARQARRRNEPASVHRLEVHGFAAGSTT